MALDPDICFMTELGLQNNLLTIQNDGLFFYHRGLEIDDSKRPVLILIHGYPQTNFMWRHIIPLLPPNIPLFIPDISGYGRSPPLPISHSKTNQSRAILKCLAAIFQSSTETPLIIAGHDRGARICHRLAVDNPNPKLPILGTILLDIVPTIVQWQSFSLPSASIGTFHWPLLANVNVAVPLIMAQGGDVFIQGCINRWLGKSSPGLAKFREDNAIAIYSDSFRAKEVVEATCDDYRAGGQEDIEEQERDQKEGKKIDIDVLAIYSKGYLGTRYDLDKIWSEWVSGKGKLETLGIGEDVGHFIAEEAPGVTAAAIVTFYQKHT